MCTTYVGAVAISQLKEMGVNLIDNPHLVRLNPNWIYKTRGNCSVSISVEVKDSKIPKTREIVLETVEELAELHIEETTPGVVFLESSEIPRKLNSYSKKVVQEVVSLEDAIELAEDVGAEVHKFREGRGVIGALAAIGHPLEKDYTYELITYRVKENRGTQRKIEEKSVERMNKEFFPESFDNLDPDTGDIRITPHTPCPILYGIRSESPETAYRAQKLVKEKEPIERMILYKTNQATDEHLKPYDIDEIEPYRSVIVKGNVSEKPETITGGHVFFSVRDKTGEIRCAAFEPTGQFRNLIRKLKLGDKVKVYGGVKEKYSHPTTINLEKIEILDLKPVKRRKNPICENCEKNMKSAGKNKGYYCEKCGAKLPPGSTKEIEVDRELEKTLYEVPPSARRHLSKPLVRMKKD
ncbi:hypothetical protein AKJ51_03420 [candidate division MSBL1 archaeon SCGC-AAA382A20]|uniref:tRNA(Ile2) 2-agmatinylcytidine synthetase TiaS n=1 Tax=candidate division MSBL1 archaeon SCGC-AAA382A20 TaxID=1698280 RepID=A0A133VJG3_9EURY|nr:hypothetical protein AKJ51_03420 [candidate division MSBL1 archaeon SCGC-AAA382A20]